MDHRMNAYWMDNHPTVYAAETADEATRLYVSDTGEVPEEGYPRQVSDVELDREVPELDENEAPMDCVTSIRQMLAEMKSPGFLGSAP